VAKITTNFVSSGYFLEIAGFGKDFEEKWDVSASGPVAVVAIPVACAAAEAKEEKTEFDVILTSVGDNHINVIKEVRATPGLGLKEAKELVDGGPKPIKEATQKADAEEMKKELEAVGKNVELKQLGGC
jgi:large subunit ribosomal protein L7/L12